MLVRLGIGSGLSKLQKRLQDIGCRTVKVADPIRSNLPFLFEASPPWRRLFRGKNAAAMQ
jgi:hypothetical protein